LSVKQLRHYDEMSLLRPARIDEATSYRYYRRDQVRDAMTIALLRQLDVPLAAIGEMLTGDDEARAAVLRAEQSRLEGRIAAQRRAWQALDLWGTKSRLTVVEQQQRACTCGRIVAHVCPPALPRIPPHHRMVDPARPRQRGQRC
jgi:DNA-binding transcriptional MerR regulator